MFNNFKRKPLSVIPKKKEDCKIKIKNTSHGRTLEFSGNCSKDQLEIAQRLGISKENISSFDSEDED